MAKYNLETRYSVVGLVEHFDTSLAVMEQYLPGEIYIVAKKIYLFNGIPAFFSGASTRFKKQSKKSNANPHPPPSNQTMYVRLTIFHPLIFMFRDILRKRLHLDIDFYEFAKQRLFLQWKKIKKKM